MTLGAYHRVDWSGTIRVPAAFTDEQVHEAVMALTDEVPGDQYETDYDYWEQAQPVIDDPYIEEDGPPKPGEPDDVDYIIDHDFTIRRPS